MTEIFELLGGILIGTISYFFFKGLLKPKTFTMKEDDADIFYRWADKIGKRPTLDQEEHFLETVAKLSEYGHPDPYCRREAFKTVFGLPAPHI